MGSPSCVVFFFPFLSFSCAYAQPQIPKANSDWCDAWHCLAFLLMLRNSKSASNGACHTDKRCRLSTTGPELPAREAAASLRCAEMNRGGQAATLVRVASPIRRRFRVPKHQEKCQAMPGVAPVAVCLRYLRLCVRTRKRQKREKEDYTGGRTH